MRRDMELIRFLLLNLEEANNIDLSEYNEEQINYHTNLIIDAGLAVGISDLSASISGDPEILADSMVFNMGWP